MKFNLVLTAPLTAIIYFLKIDYKDSWLKVKQFSQTMMSLVRKVFTQKFLFVFLIDDLTPFITFI